MHMIANRYSLISKLPGQPLEEATSSLNYIQRRHFVRFSHELPHVPQPTRGLPRYSPRGVRHFAIYTDQLLCLPVKRTFWINRRPDQLLRRAIETSRPPTIVCPCLERR